MDLFFLAVQIIDENKTLLPKNVVADQSALRDVLSVVFAIVGVLAFLVIVIAGFQFVISGGDPQKVTKARQAILYAVVGIVVSAAAFTIVRFVVGGAS